MTNKPWHLVPLLAAAALAASAYWWHAESEAWNPPPARKPDLPKLEPLPTPVLIRAKQALERPLFWASRRPVEKDEKKGGLSKELQESRLTAVLESGQARIALLQRKDGSQFKITAETKPWRIESFDGRRAVFLSVDEQRVERPLEAGAGAEAKGAATAGRARRSMLD